MLGETIRKHARDGWPAPRPIHSAGPPQESSTHATLVAKAPTRRAKRKRSGREARAFTLYLLARRCRARLLK